MQLLFDAQEILEWAERVLTRLRAVGNALGATQVHHKSAERLARIEPIYCRCRWDNVSSHKIPNGKRLVWRPCAKQLMTGTCGCVRRRGRNKASTLPGNGKAPKVPLGDAEAISAKKTLVLDCAETHGQ